MSKESNKSENASKKSLAKKMRGIVYDEHFTRATESVDLMKSSKFVDLGDGITSRKESEIDKFTK
ncbi:MAG TPA: hypothetical protein VN131_06145 [Mobilitalea sp.]|nr:hypothetical protein [Mobilitalea sp.]